MDGIGDTGWHPRISARRSVCTGTHILIDSVVYKEGKASSPYFSLACYNQRQQRRVDTYMFHGFFRKFSVLQVM